MGFSEYTKNKNLLLNMASKKKCLVFETLGRVDTMDIMESKDDGAVRLHGVFGVCGVKNGNNRIYSKENYGRMVENLQKVIANEGCLGELEHPNTMNINLDNVSHKIESIEMDESGTITGTIRLLDTVKGKNAKAIVEAGCPLFISSRGAGSIDEAGNVTLSTIKTYDLVGTPGFSQAKLTLKENQKFESLNENLSVIYEEEDDLLGTDDDDKKEGDDEGKSDDKEKENIGAHAERVKKPHEIRQQLFRIERKNKHNPQKERRCADIERPEAAFIKNCIDKGADDVRNEHHHCYNISHKTVLNLRRNKGFFGKRGLFGGLLFLRFVRINHTGAAKGAFFCALVKFNTAVYAV